MSIVGERSIGRIVERLVREGVVPDEPAFRREAGQVALDAARRRIRQIVRESIESWLGVKGSGLRKSAG